jgi:flagellar basal body-associated protein FliL
MAGLAPFWIIIICLVVAAASVIAAASIHRVARKSQYQKRNLTVPDDQAAYLREVRRVNVHELMEVSGRR